MLCLQIKPSDKRKMSIKKKCGMNCNRRRHFKLNVIKRICPCKQLLLYTCTFSHCCSLIFLESDTFTKCIFFAFELLTPAFTSGPFQGLWNATSKASWDSFWFYLFIFYQKKLLCLFTSDSVYFLINHTRSSRK